MEQVNWSHHIRDWEPVILNAVGSISSCQTVAGFFSRVNAMFTSWTCDVTEGVLSEQNDSHCTAVCRREQRGLSTEGVHQPSKWEVLRFCVESSQ